MNDSRDYYIFGQPVEFLYGTIRFLTYKEYILNMHDLNLLTYNVLHFYYQYRNAMLEQGELTDDVEQSLEEMKSMNLLQIVRSNEMFLNVYIKIFELLIEVDENDIDLYNEIFFEIFEDEKPSEEDMPTLKNLVVFKILSDEDIFGYVRQTIMDMNVLVEDDVSPNPIIQAGFDRAKQYQQAKSGDGISFVDIVTSIIANSNLTFEQIGNMNVYQVYAIYYRIAAKFNYNTSILFATVAPDVKIEEWNKHIDLFEKTDTTIKRDQFIKDAKGLFS